MVIFRERKLLLVGFQLSSCSEHSCRHEVRSLESFGNESQLQQMHNTSCSEDRDRSVTNDYDDFDISCRQFYFFSFPGELSGLHSPVPVGFPPGPVFTLPFLLKPTFVSRKMVDMQNVEQLTPRCFSYSGCLRNEI